MSHTAQRKPIHYVSTTSMLLMIALLSTLLWLKPWQTEPAGMALGQTTSNQINAKAGAKLGEKLSFVDPSLGKHLGKSLETFSDVRTMVQN